MQTNSPHNPRSSCLSKYEGSNSSAARAKTCRCRNGLLLLSLITSILLSGATIGSCCMTCVMDPQLLSDLQDQIKKFQELSKVRFGLSLFDVTRSSSNNHSSFACLLRTLNIRNGLVESCFSFLKCTWREFLNIPSANFRYLPFKAFKWCFMIFVLLMQVLFAKSRHLTKALLVKKDCILQIHQGQVNLKSLTESGRGPYWINFRTASYHEPDFFYLTTSCFYGRSKRRYQFSLTWRAETLRK